jgi:hypothetical protein
VAAVSAAGLAVAASRVIAAGAGSAVVDVSAAGTAVAAGLVHGALLRHHRTEY